MRSSLKTLWPLMVFVALEAACLSGCSDDSSGGNNDAAVNEDAALSDSQVSGDTGTGEVIADLLLSNCPSWETHDSTSVCVGTAPLTLNFAPLTSSNIDSFQWDFGDGSPRQESRLAEHTYQEPGSFDVTLLVGGHFGILEVKSHGLVRIEEASLGAYCQAHNNCSTGHCHCLHQEGENQEAACPEELMGLCTQTCLERSCLDGECVDLRLASSPEVTDASTWRQPLCLPPCVGDADCKRPGARCVDAPLYTHQSTTPNWTSVCLPPVLSDVGEPCVDEDGLPEDDLCLGGRCLDLGAGGICSQSCEAGTCPSDSGCVVFNGTGDSVCLSICDPDHLCDFDPLLACESPDGAGFLGFSEASGGPVPMNKYCAPKSCSEDTSCGWGGTCDEVVGGYCLPNG